jgi:hypothetical protein
MTPDEVRTRLAAAVEPLDPSPDAYRWLRANVSRRRTAWVTWAAAGAAVLVTVVAAVAVTRPGPERGGVAGDLDGDGRADTAVVVESGPRLDPEWRWGVRVAYATGETRTVWYSGEMFRYVDQPKEVAGYADLDGDGRDEVVVRTYGGNGLDAYVVLAGTEWVRKSAPDEVNAFLVDSGSGWGCAELDATHDGLEVYTAGERLGDVGRGVLALEGARLRVLDVPDDDKWAWARLGRVECGALSLPVQPSAVHDDVDGDGTADRARLVEEPGRWGVRVELSATGPATTWLPDDVEPGTPRVEWLVDLAGDGRAEVVVGLDPLGDETRRSMVLTLVDGTLTWLREGNDVKLLREERPSSYGCADVLPEPGRELLELRVSDGSWVLLVSRIVDGHLVFGESDKGTGTPPRLGSCVPLEWQMRGR